MIIVCILNVLQCFYCARTLFDELWDTDLALLMVGDAVESFLKRPDPCTVGQGLLSKKQVDHAMVRRNRWKATKEARIFENSATTRWYTAAGVRSFTATTSL
jgi:hypothetical protein